MNKFTEAQLEKAFIDLLEQEQIPYVPGVSINRTSQEVLIKEDLESFLSKKYKAEQITQGEIHQIIRQLETYSASDLYESNKAIMKLVSDGFILKREDRAQKDLYIQFIDYSGLNKQFVADPKHLISIVADPEVSYGAH